MKKSFVVTLGLLSAFGPLSIDLYLPGLPQVANDLQVSAGDVALTLTSCTVGLGIGQLVVGPLSDRFGRRVPLLAGVAIFAVFSLMCAEAQTLPLLVAARFVQSLGGAAGIVLARAVARDLRSGHELVRLFSLMFAVNGLAPVIAPLLGAQLLRVGSWRIAFIALAILGALIFVLVWRVVPESLDAGNRQQGGPADALRAYRTLLGDRLFVGQVLTGEFAFATLFAYISAAPFVLQDRYGFSAQLFSAVFAANAVGLVLGTRVGGPRRAVACTGVAAVGCAGGIAERADRRRAGSSATRISGRRHRHRSVQPHNHRSRDADSPAERRCRVGAAGRRAVHHRRCHWTTGRARCVRRAAYPRGGHSGGRRFRSGSGLGQSFVKSHPTERDTQASMEAAPAPRVQLPIIGGTMTTTDRRTLLVGAAGTSALAVFGAAAFASPADAATSTRPTLRLGYKGNWVLAAQRLMWGSGFWLGAWVGKRLAGW